MDNHELEQTIEPISEEMAQALIDAFEEDLERTQELHDTVTRFLWSAAENAMLRTAEIYAKKVVSYTKATFLTKWHKKRQMEKAKASFDKAVEIYTDWRNRWHDSCKEENHGNDGRTDTDS